MFCVERPSKEGAPLGGGIELCGSSSCVGGLRCLLNTEGILILPMFLWVMDLWYKCEVLLLLDDVGCCCLCLLLWNLLSSAFEYFVEMWLFLKALVVWFLWSETLFWGPVGFTYVFSCAVVGWAFPVVDYINFMDIWNRIFWMHE